MNISAIITEYNPLHKGHIYHIEKTKKITNCEALVCVMSGNFVQRGLPAIIDKWERTYIALKSGVDLVIELPVVYSLSSAEFFSYGAISILNSLNIINNICFGSELGDLKTLYEIAKILNNENNEFKFLLNKHLNLGISFPKARENAIKEYNKNNLNLDIEDTLKSSNNILGIEYIKSLMRLDSNITPFTIKRTGGNYNSNELEKISSATSIRNFIFENDSIETLKNYLPKHTYEIIKKYSKSDFVNPNNMVPYLKFKTLIYGDTLVKIPDVKEGLENKIIEEMLKENNFNNILLNIKSKRYTVTRISRILTEFFIGFERFNIENLRKKPAPYARILGFTSKGQKVLKLMKKNSNIPILNKIPKDKNDFLELDLKSTAAYSLLNKKIRYNEDYFRKPIIIKD